MVILSTLLAAAAGQAAGQTKLAVIPLEVLAYKGELIVVGRVLEVGRPAEQELSLPGGARPVRGWFAACKVRIERVLKEVVAKPKKKEPAAESEATETPEAPTTTPAAGATIAVLARSARPSRRGIGMLSRDARKYPRLVAKSRYVLMLRRLPGRPQYYLPSEGRNYRPALRTEIAKVERAAGVDNWPWGEQLGGLRLALVLTRPIVEYQPQQIIGGSSSGRGAAVRRIGGAQVRAVVALRNTSGEAITLSTYKWDEFLSLRAAGPEDKLIAHDFYKYGRSARQPAFARKYTSSIQPGKVVFIGPEGPGERGIAIRMPLNPGRWALKAVYSSERQAGDEEEKLWTGKIESAPVPIQVRRSPGFAPRPGRGARRK